MRWLRLLHLYVGLALALFLLVLAVTGGALVYKDDFRRVRHAALAEPVAPADAAHHAQVFEAVARFFAGEAVWQIKLPRPDFAAYHVYLRHGGEAFVSQDGQRVIDRWQWYTDPLALLTELHINLAAGRPGRIVAGAIGVATAGMAVSGLILWWPLRRRLSGASFMPRDLRRATLLRLHRDLGAVAAPLIVLFALTGAGVVFYGASRVLLNGIFGDSPADASQPRIEAMSPVGMATGRVIEIAQAALPGARLMSYYPPPEGSGVHYFRLRQAGEIHPNGRSMAFVDGTEVALHTAIDATVQRPGERAAQWLYPLHAARTGSEAYRLLAVAVALGLAVMAATGPVTWLQMRRRRTANRSFPVTSTARGPKRQSAK